LRVLVITRSAWDDSNSTGNTMTNIFYGWDPEKIANVYCRAAKPNNPVCKKYFSIPEKDLYKSLIKRNYKIGKSFNFNNVNNEKNTANEIEEQKQEEKIYNYFRNNFSTVARWGQELLWFTGKWKNDNLDEFLSKFKPDIIFSPSFYSIYAHNLLWYIQKRTGAKVVLFHVTDYLKSHSFNGGLYKLNRKWLSRIVMQSALKADLNYCISPKQKEEYSTKIGRTMKVLFKGGNFYDNPEPKIKKSKDLVRIVYVGSILKGRWKTLSSLAKAIQKINEYKPTFELLIYSQYKPSKEIESSIVFQNASQFRGKLPANRVQETLQNADIVLHVESFEKKEKLSTRLSFSTKIVDCLQSGSCVMAIGWEQAASIDYLIKNDAALVITDENFIIKQLEEIQKNPSMIEDYAHKAWQCGKENHSIEKIQNMLISDFECLLNS